MFYFNCCTCQFVCMWQRYAALNVRVVETSVVSRASVPNVRRNYEREFRLSVRNCRVSLSAITCWTSIKSFTTNAANEIFNFMFAKTCFSRQTKINSYVRNAYFINYMCGQHLKNISCIFYEFKSQIRKYIIVKNVLIFIKKFCFYFSDLVFKDYF